MGHPMTKDVPAFLDEGRRLAVCIRDAMGLPGGSGSQKQYLVKSFVRNALVAQVHRYLPEMWEDDVTIQRLGDWCPDTKEHLQPIRTWSARSAQELGRECSIPDPAQRTMLYPCEANFPDWNCSLLHS